jgi:RecB family exonuclease
MSSNDLSRLEFKISYSRINAYLFCPHKYKLIYIDNKHIPVTGDISFGHTIHSTLEKYHKANREDIDFLMECYDESWKQGGFNSALETYEYYLRGQKMLKNYFETFKQNPSEVLCIERKFETNIGKYKFIGIIDRVDKCRDGSYEVIDYKTHIKIWDQEKVDKDLQLSFYVYACKTILGFNTDKASVYFLSENKKITTKRSGADIEHAIDLALNCAHKITQEEDFSPNTVKCSLCDFKKSCNYSIYKELEEK